jgi:transposase
MAEKCKVTIAVIGIDIGKNSFHVVGLDARGAIVLRQKWSRGQVEARLANMAPCLIGMEACVGAHHLSRKLKALGHDARLMPAKYVRAYSKGQKNFGALIVNETKKWVELIRAANIKVE